MCRLSLMLICRRSINLVPVFSAFIRIIHIVRIVRLSHHFKCAIDDYVEFQVKIFG